jgi:catechol 2,3-dioxygenase-like lactoylglutathione lyase family enzyme
MGKTSGVHHVAMGVKNLEPMKSFYRNIMGFTEIFAEFDESEQEIMREVTRSSRTVFSGVILQQKAGGILLELIHMSEPIPRPIRKDFRYGDIGVAKITLAVYDVQSVFEELKGKVNFCSQPKVIIVPGWSDYSFVYCRDPEGNLVEIVSANAAGKGGFAGARAVGISVTDLERSVSFYQNHLGFNIVVMNIHESFSGLVDEVSKATGTCVRSCLLSANAKGDAMIELFEVLKPRGRSIPFAVNWGDFGYLQVGFSCDNIHEVASEIEAAGMNLLCRPKVMDGGIPDHPGEFVYARDPDGIPIEFLFLRQ